MKHQQLICLTFILIHLVVCSMNCQKIVKNVVCVSQSQRLCPEMSSFVYNPKIIPLLSKRSKETRIC